MGIRAIAWYYTSWLLSTFSYRYFSPHQPRFTPFLSQFWKRKGPADGENATLQNEFMSKTTRQILLSCLSIGVVMALCVGLTLIAFVILLTVG
jgi:hypothetical protein